MDENVSSHSISRQVLRLNLDNNKYDTIAGTGTFVTLAGAISTRNTDIFNSIFGTWQGCHHVSRLSTLHYGVINKFGASRVYAACYYFET